MKLSNELLTGVAIGVGVAMLLRPKVAAPVLPGYPTLPPATTSPANNRSRGDAYALGSYQGRRRSFQRVGYPVYLGF